MKNMVHERADSLPLVAPYNVASGDGFLVGALFAVASHAALSGETVTGRLIGTFDLPKAASITPTQGAKAYWDNTAKKVTDVATSNTEIGRFTVAALGADPTARVRLNG